jgi:ferredoxin
MGRLIEKKETFDILARAADAGLVHAASNTKTGVDTVCNCCSCCCIFLEKIIIEPPCPRGHQRSNYVVEKDEQVCRHCGLCAKRCPIGAMELKPVAAGMHEAREKGEKATVYNPERCIGCGVCVHKCPAGALSLVRRGREEPVPENMMDAGMRMLHERGRDMRKIF